MDAGFGSFHEFAYCGGIGGLGLWHHANGSAIVTSPFAEHLRGITLRIRLSPGAKTEDFHGLAETADGEAALKASVHAPPENGKANKSLIALISKRCKVPKSSISLLSGETNRNKVLLIEGDSALLLEKTKILSDA